MRQTGTRALKNMPAWLWESACRGSTRIVGDRRDKLDCHPAFPVRPKKEQETNLTFLNIGNLSTELKHASGRAQDE